MIQTQKPFMEGVGICSGTTQEHFVGGWCCITLELANVRELSNF